MFRDTTESRTYTGRSKPKFWGQDEKQNFIIQKTKTIGSRPGEKPQLKREDKPEDLQTGSESMLLG